MRGGHFDEDDALPVRYAVVYAPKAGKRKRFSETCVRETATAEEALAGADPAAGFHAAKVAGPSRSSEGFRLYYLVKWL